MAASVMRKPRTMSPLVLAVILILLLLSTAVSAAQARQMPDAAADTNNSKSSSNYTTAAVPAAAYYDGMSYLEAYPAAVERARATVSCWMAKLAAGPSRRGPGHK